MLMFQILSNLKMHLNCGRTYIFKTVYNFYLCVIFYSMHVKSTLQELT